MKRRLLMAVLSSVVLWAGCAHTGRPGVTAKDPLVARTRAAAAELEQLRGLPEKWPIRIQVLDRTAFSKLVRRSFLAGMTPEDLDRERAVWIGFGFATPDIEADKSW